MRTDTAVGLIAALMLTGCTGKSRGSRPRKESLTTATATVENVDQSTRNVTLRDDADGTTFAVTAGPKARNLDQVTPATTSGSTSTVRPPSAWPIRPTPASRRAPWSPGAAERAARAGLAAVTDSMVVTVVGYDRNSGLATFRTPDGFTRLAVVPPELRNFAKTRGPGSRVLVTMTRAVAVSVAEAAPA